MTRNSNHQLIFLGAPASGKGTHARLMQEKLGIEIIDTGSLLREEIKNGTERGQEIQKHIDKGNLAPTPIVAAIIADKLKDCQQNNKGFILDGYPRSIEQADALVNIIGEDGLEQITVINIDYPEGKLLKRIVNRRLCKDCGAIYNLLFSPSKKENICDECGGELYQRADDNEEVMKTRLQTYYEKTQPLTAHYEKMGILHNIDGDIGKENVFAAILDIVEKKLTNKVNF